jgi:hypothetical protein
MSPFFPIVKQPLFLKLIVKKVLDRESASPYIPCHIDNGIHFHDNRRILLLKSTSLVKRTAWPRVSDRFHDHRQTLGAFLAFEAAEVLDGIKPANLVNIVNRRRPCGRNLYRLWHQFGPALLRQTPLSFFILADRGDSLLLLLYRPEMLDALLRDKRVQALLTRAGYPSDSDRSDMLVELRRRLRPGTFPHEIGIFLGYPLKDVLGFMGWARIPFSCQGPWKIYGRQGESLALAESHRQCRCRMANQLAGCGNPLDCLRADSTGH